MRLEVTVSCDRQVSSADQCDFSCIFSTYGVEPLGGER